MISRTSELASASQTVQPIIAPRNSPVISVNHCATVSRMQSDKAFIVDTSACHFMADDNYVITRERIIMFQKTLAMLELDPQVMIIKIVMRGNERTVMYQYVNDTDRQVHEVHDLINSQMEMSNV